MNGTEEKAFRTAFTWPKEERSFCKPCAQLQGITSLVYLQEPKPGEPSTHHVALILTHINQYQSQMMCNQNQRLSHLA